MKRITVALATLIAIPVLISNDVVIADGSKDYLLNCRPEGLDRCFSEYQANARTEWEKIRNTYENMLDAFNRKDINQWSAAFVPEYKVRQPNGQEINLAQLRQNHQQLWQKASQHRISAKIISRDVGREYATVMSIEYIDATLPNANNSRVPMRIQNTSEQTWRLTSDGWKLVYARTIDQKSYAVGQPPTGSMGVGRPIDGGLPGVLQEAGNGLSHIR